MAASASLLQLPSLSPRSLQLNSRLNNIFKPNSLALAFPKPNNGFPRCSFIACASNNGRESEDGVKSVECLVEEKKRAELAARIASGEFTVEQSGFLPQLKSILSKFGVPKEFLDILPGSLRDYPEVPQAKGALSSLRGEPFFIPLYELFLTYGGIFRLSFGPKFELKGNPGRNFRFCYGEGPDPSRWRSMACSTKGYCPSIASEVCSSYDWPFGRATDRLCKKLDAAASDGEDVEMESLFSRLTLDIIGNALFNYEFDSLSNDTGIVEAVYTVLREAEDRSVSPIPVWDIPVWKDISPRQRKVTASLKLINDTLNDLIAICKRMVEEEELQFHEEYINEKDPSILHFLLASGDDVSSKQLRDDLMTMLIAGHETSAAVLTWTFYLLSKEPGVMAKLQDEVDSVLGDRFPTVEDMKNLKYTTRVINESLRLYPQPPVLIRRSLEDDVLGQYPIRRGEDIFISVWNLHHCPNRWIDAEKFNPERWPIDGPNPNEVNQNFSYLPFGGGPRKCVGDMFATFENIVAITMLVRRFNFQLALGAPLVGMTTGATIHTTEGLKMTVTRRMITPIIPKLEKKFREVDGEKALKTPPTVLASMSTYDGDQ
ncbi:hypothetical protein IFM89_025028 [Coptis chinensis]|uniref:Cytochrome P450 n=1 Tax=Coptis chinensis TaxID=261450 RepID=A0A835HUP8_9MAGN|nr:hypothetical protein IFM89_025028 [Coptis chinensis]